MDCSTKAILKIVPGAERCRKRKKESRKFVIEKGMTNQENLSKSIVK